MWSRAEEVKSLDMGSRTGVNVAILNKFIQL